MRYQDIILMPRHDFLTDTHAPSDEGQDADVPIRGAGSGLAGFLLQQCSRLLPMDWRILLWDAETDEIAIASDAAVEFRQVAGGCLALTSVQGDMTPARGTALCRLAGYTGGDNASGTAIEAERPLRQWRQGRNLWQIGVRLHGMDDILQAPAPRTGQVQIVYERPTTWAVLRRNGRPSERGLERAETAILDVVARTRWFPIGPATLRLLTPCALLPFAGSFEVAVPVALQADDTPHSPVTAPTAISRPANWGGRPIH